MTQIKVHDHRIKFGYVCSGLKSESEVGKNQLGTL